MSYFRKFVYCLFGFTILSIIEQFIYLSTFIVFCIRTNGIKLIAEVSRRYPVYIKANMDTTKKFIQTDKFV